MCVCVCMCVCVFTMCVCVYDVCVSTFIMMYYIKLHVKHYIFNKTYEDIQLSLISDLANSLYISNESSSNQH